MRRQISLIKLITGDSLMVSSRNGEVCARVNRKGEGKHQNKMKMIGRVAIETVMSFRPPRGEKNGGRRQGGEGREEEGGLRGRDGGFRRPGHRSGDRREESERWKRRRGRGRGRDGRGLEDRETD